VSCGVIRRFISYSASILSVIVYLLVVAVTDKFTTHIRVLSFKSSDLEEVYTTLTLIRTAGGVYDFGNFEEVYLCNG
jgi:hypothetical protein